MSGWQLTQWQYWHHWLPSQGIPPANLIPLPLLWKTPLMSSPNIQACLLCIVARSFLVTFRRCSQGCIFRLTCSYPELTEDDVLTSAYVKIFRTVTRNALNKSVWRKKYCFWLPLNKHAMNIWLSSLRIRAHLSWRTGKHRHGLHVLRTYSTCSYPGY